MLASVKCVTWFPLIKLAKKLKQYNVDVERGVNSLQFPLIKLAKKLKVF